MKSRRQVQEMIHSIGRWYQHFEFPNGARTGNGQEPGYDAQTRWDIIKPFIPQYLKGRTVLDLGGNAGFFSTQMKLRGASRCVLVDPFSEFIAQARFTASQFEVDLELVNDDAHTFCLTNEEQFDYVIFLGLLYHLKYPGLVLDRLAEMTQKRIFIHSHIVGKHSKNYKEKTNYERTKENNLLEDPAYPKMLFIENDYNGDPTNWWIPNYQGLAALVRSAGLKIIERPHSELIIAEPEISFGKVSLTKLVFPKYGKRGKAIYPGPQRYDADMWLDLIQRSKEPNQEKDSQ